MKLKKHRKSAQAGMTLVEIMVAFLIFSIVMGALYSLSYSFSEVSNLQQAKATNMDNCRSTLNEVIRELRQAVKMSIDFTTLPAASITYQIPEDLDGNGCPVDVGSYIELGPPRTITLDFDDINGDGITTSQLLLIVNGEIETYLANNLNPDLETVDEEGVFGPQNDLDGDGSLDRGFWITFENNGFTIEVQGMQESLRGRDYVNALTAFVVPRN